MSIRMMVGSEMGGRWDELTSEQWWPWALGWARAMGQHWTSGWMCTRMMTHRQQDYGWVLGHVGTGMAVGAGLGVQWGHPPSCFQLQTAASTSIIEAGITALALPHPIPGQVPAGGLALLSGPRGGCHHHVGAGQPLRRAAEHTEHTPSPAAMSVPIAKSFYDLSATSLQGEKVDFNVFRGRVVLIENVASL